MARLLVLVANGTEEMEFVITVDMLRRAKLEVVAAAVGDDVSVTGSRHVRLVADTTLERVRLDDFDGLVIPGGAQGVECMAKHAGVLEAVRHFDRARKLVAAICAGPIVLHAAGILQGRSFTCYPGVEKAIAGARRRDEKVVTDEHILTSQGPGTAFAFALAIIARFEGEIKAQEVARTALLSGALANG